MTALLTLTAHARIGRLALVAAALVIGIVAFTAPAVTEAAGTAPTAGMSENFVFMILALALGLVVGGVTTAGTALAGLVEQAGL